MGLPRQEYWSGLPWPSPGDLPHPGIEPTSHASVLASGFFTTSTTWEPNQTKVTKSNQNLTNQKVTFKVNGKLPQMWPPSPNRPVTLVWSPLYRVSLHRENTPNWSQSPTNGAEAPQVGAIAPKRTRSKKLWSGPNVKLFWGKVTWVFNLQRGVVSIRAVSRLTEKSHRKYSRFL